MKIGLVDPEIIGLQDIIKKETEEKKEEINASKIYKLSARMPSGLDYLDYNERTRI